MNGGQIDAVTDAIDKLLEQRAGLVKALAQIYELANHATTVNAADRLGRIMTLAHNAVIGIDGRGLNERR
jgi:hypothetical protein